MSTPDLELPRHEWQPLLADSGVLGSELHSCVIEGLSVATVSRIGGAVLADLRFDDGSGTVETVGLESRAGAPGSIQEAMLLVEEALSLAAHR